MMEKVKGVLSTMMEKLTAKRGSGSNGGAIGKEVKPNKNIILVSILAIAVILTLSIYFLMNGKHDKELRDEYRARINEMNSKLQTANTKGYANDKETANAILEQIETEARDILEDDYFRTEILDLMQRVQETRDSINNTTRLEEVPPYVDLSSKNSEIEALGLMNMDDNFFAYEYNMLYEVILDQILEPKKIDETEVVTKGTAMEDQGILVFLTQSGRVIEYNNGQFSFANTADESWKSGVDIMAYGKYIYILNPNDNQIYKYSRLRSSYSSVTEYNLDANLSGAISMAIDGNIYVLKKGGEIVKIFKSKKQDFAIEDLATDLSEATQIFTTPELNNMYILDPVNKRVVVAEKEVGPGARYKEQLFFEELNDIKSIYVNKKEDKIYVLTKKAIYETDI